VFVESISAVSTLTEISRPAEAFNRLAPRFPVFELQPLEPFS